MSAVRKFAWLSVATAVATIALKLGAWWLTGSVGLLSDAAESLVNLVAAVVALIAISAAEKPADDDHQFGHSKAEYFSAGAEGAMIVVASMVIVGLAIERLMHPQQLESLDIGLGISVVAAVLNAIIGVVLIQGGRSHRSPSLVADGKHLLTDVGTTCGVIAGVGLVAITGWQWLDPVVAITVGLVILVFGFQMVRESGSGLLDGTLPEDENSLLERILDDNRQAGVVDFHELRTRESGKRRFVEFHVLVPGSWSVSQGHDLVERVEQEIHRWLPHTHVSSHLEPIEDERAYNDVHL